MRISALSKPPIRVCRSTGPLETVQEFQTNRRNYSAELGFASGGVINIVTKAGTNLYDTHYHTHYHKNYKNG